MGLMKELAIRLEEAGLEVKTENLKYLDLSEVWPAAATVPPVGEKLTCMEALQKLLQHHDSLTAEEMAVINGLAGRFRD